MNTINSTNEETKANQSVKRGFAVLSHHRLATTFAVSMGIDCKTAFM